MEKQLGVIICLLIIISMLLYGVKVSQDTMNDKFEHFTNQISIYDDKTEE